MVNSIKSYLFFCLFFGSGACFAPSPSRQEEKEYLIRQFCRLNSTISSLNNSYNPAEANEILLQEYSLSENDFIELMEKEVKKNRKELNSLWMNKHAQKTNNNDAASLQKKSVGFSPRFECSSDKDLYYFEPLFFNEIIFDLQLFMKKDFNKDFKTAYLELIEILKPIISLQSEEFTTDNMIKTPLKCLGKNLSFEKNAKGFALVQRVTGNEYNLISKVHPNINPEQICACGAEHLNINPKKVCVCENVIKTIISSQLLITDGDVESVRMFGKKLIYLLAFFKNVYKFKQSKFLNANVSLIIPHIDGLIEILENITTFGHGGSSDKTSDIMYLLLGETIKLDLSNDTFDDKYSSSLGNTLDVLQDEAFIKSLKHLF